jgi:steroid delta-isomerase-like uncharacterized protein
MSAEENKNVVRRFARMVVSRGDFGVFEELVAPDFAEHSTPPGVPPTRDTLRHFIEGFRAAFPDLETSEEDLVAEGDKVVYRGTIRGTHRGEFMGIPPTGQRIEIGEIQVQRLAGGQLAEHWGQLDWLALLRQLGANPTPGHAH